MSSLQTTPYVRDIVESYVHYRKVAGLKPLGRSHKVYQRRNYKMPSTN